MSPNKKIAVVALGGNALLRAGEKGTISEQEKNAENISGFLLPLIEKGYELIITHGNGPQVGNILLKNELAKDVLPVMPLDVCVADSEGSIGYIMQQALLNHFRERKLRKFVVAMITQVVVDQKDPAFQNPTKPIGKFYTREEAETLQKEKGWVMMGQRGRGFRRAVPSPKPIKIIQRDMVRTLVKAGHVVIAAGGGGIPIWKKPDGKYEGIEAVVDKDLASAVLAVETPADIFIILTEVNQVALNFKTENQKNLKSLTAGEAKKYLDEGQFPAGSMGPKIEAALYYLNKVDKKVVITSPESLVAALDGNDGTALVRG